MATQTTNYNLSKPDANDPFGNFRQSYNDNMDIIDANLGGGGGGSIQITSTVLFEPTAATSANVDYTLSDSIDNYDFISIINGVWSEYYGTGDKFAEDSFVPVDTFNRLYADSKQYAITSYSTRFLHLNLHSSTLRVTAKSNLDVCKIIGHKLSGGGGSSVTWTQIQATGEKIAEITISGTTTDVLIPFEAKIIVTTTTGLTVTATKGGTTYTATETSSGTYEVEVDSSGTWTVTDGTNTTMVSVTAQTTYNVAFVVIPDGSTVTPTDDIQTWLNCADIWDKAYTTLAEVLADSTTLSALISDNNAVDYMVRSTTWASGMCADSTAMTYIGLNNYCANKLLADATWRTAICNSTYFESVLNVKVPVMTSNTTPSGECIGIDEFDASMKFFRAFDGDNTTKFAPATYPNNEWIGYDFGTAKNIYFVKFYSRDSHTYKIQYSDDKVTWNDASAVDSAVNNTWLTKVISPNLARYWRYLSITNSGAMYMFTLQFYGREDV